VPRLADVTGVDGVLFRSDWRQVDERRNRSTIWRTSTNSKTASARRIMRENALKLIS
jgi:hypothetical protein